MICVNVCKHITVEFPTIDTFPRAYLGFYYNFLPTTMTQVVSAFEAKIQQLTRWDFAYTLPERVFVNLCTDTTG